MSKKHIKVLLIEDNQGDVRLIWEILSEVRNSPFYLEVGDTLLAGLNAIQKSPPDVILLDLSLPDSNGIYTLNRVRDKAKNVPVVVMTGLDDEMTAIKALKEGAQDYLVKGRTDSDLLKRAILYAIERNRLMMEIEEKENKMNALVDKMIAQDRIRSALFLEILGRIESGVISEEFKQNASLIKNIYIKSLSPETVSSFDPAVLGSIDKIKFEGAGFNINCDKEKFISAFKLFLVSVKEGINIKAKLEGRLAELVLTGNISEIIKAFVSYKNNSGASGVALEAYLACGILESSGCVLGGAQDEFIIKVSADKA